MPFIPVLAVPAAALVNAVFVILKVKYFDGPYFFDSIFTILVGIFYGWVPGLFTGLLTNVLVEVFSGFEGVHWPFALVNMTTGVLAGLIAADKSRYWTFSRHILLVSALTVSNAFLGTFIVNVVYGGISGAMADVLVGALYMMGDSMILASLLARIPINLVDKGLPVLAIFIVHQLIVRRRSVDGSLEDR